MVMLTRKRLLAAKIEAAEGTAESLAGADATLTAYDISADVDVKMFDLDPIKNNLSQIQSVPGLKGVTFKFKTALMGSGSIATAPSYGKLLKGCGMAETALNKITTGAVTNTISHGSTITGGTSGATGRVVGRQTGGGTHTLYYVALTGTFQNAEVITSNDTPAGSATSSSGPSSNQGFEYKPDSNGGSSLTLGLYQQDSPVGGSDTMLILGRGGRGSWKLSHKVGEPVFIEFEFKAVYQSVTDTTMLTAVLESTIPPAYLSAALVLGTYSPLFSAIDIDYGAQVNPRLNANDASGQLSFRVTERMPTGSIDPERTKVATKDFFGDWTTPNMSYFEETIGVTAGNQLKVFAPAFQIFSIGDGARNDIQTNQMGIRFNTTKPVTGDDEISLVMI